MTETQNRLSSARCCLASRFRVQSQGPTNRLSLRVSDWQFVGLSRRSVDDVGKVAIGQSPAVRASKAANVRSQCQRARAIDPQGTFAICARMFVCEKTWTRSAARVASRNRTNERGSSLESRDWSAADGMGRSHNAFDYLRLSNRCGCGSATCIFRAESDDLRPELSVWIGEQRHRNDYL